MASEGELVKMKDGRWARYREVLVTSGSYLPTMLVAVELEPRLQALLDEASAAFQSVQLCLREALDGSLSVQVADVT